MGGAGDFRAERWVKEGEKDSVGPRQRESAEGEYGPRSKYVMLRCRRDESLLRMLK